MVDFIMKVYKVGGYVRDKLLGLPNHKDIDYVVVGSSPEEMLSNGFTPVGKDFPVFLHPETRQEYALARKELKRGNGYHGFIFDTSEVSLEDDLFRRDLTINAIAEDSEGNIIDPYCGIHDLKEKVIRHVSNHFKEDPLRVLRVARFKAKMPSFTVHPSTIGLMSSMVEELKFLTPERICLELQKALSTKKPSLFFDTLRDCGALEVVFPAIHSMIGVPQREDYHPEGDVYNHTMIALDSLDSDESFKIKYATLMHDIGKTVTPEQFLPSHPNHETNGLELVEAESLRLKVSTEVSKFAYLTVKYHMMGNNFTDIRPAKIIRMLKDMRAMQDDSIIADFCKVIKADSHGKWRTHTESRLDEFLNGCITTIKRVSLKDLTDKFKGKQLTDLIEQRLILRVKAYRKLFESSNKDIIKESKVIVDRLSKDHQDKKIVFMIVAGSHFFDMSTATSDLDIKGVYIPYGEDTKIGEVHYNSNNRGNNSKNTSSDVDVTLYSLSKFMRLIGEGDFNMLEMLYAPGDKILIDSSLFVWLRSTRQSFLSKNISPFLGFIKKEYRRAAISGDNYNAFVKLYDLIKDWGDKSTLKDHWGDIVEYSKDSSNLMHITKSSTGNNNMIDSFVVAHRMFQCTIRVEYLKEEIQDRLKIYSYRKTERDDSGVDYKAMYHAKRLCLEAKDIIDERDINIPFSDSRKKLLMSIKGATCNPVELDNSISEDIAYLRDRCVYNDTSIDNIKNMCLRVASNIENEVEIYNIRRKYGKK